MTAGRRKTNLAAPRKVSASPVAGYAVSSPRGQMVLEIGSREAVWNGVEINLGFAPEIIDDQVFVYGLDLQKNLEPLLLGVLLAPGTNRVIVIDPGHGGANVGTHSALDGRLEKEFTLDWAKRLKPLLETNGWTVFLTRTGDSYVTNASRVVFAEAHHADLFISLHFNSTARNKRPAAWKRIVLRRPECRPRSRGGYADPWAEKLPGNNFDAQSLQLAVKLQGALLRASGMDEGVRHARTSRCCAGKNAWCGLIEGGLPLKSMRRKKLKARSTAKNLRKRSRSAEMKNGKTSFSSPAAPVSSARTWLNGC